MSTGLAQRVTNWGTTTGYLIGWRLVRLLPERAARWIFATIAARIYAGNGRGVQRLRSNLARIVADDQLEQTVKAGVGTYLRYWCEAFRLPSWDTADLVARTVTVDQHHLDEALAAGRGVVAALPHMGNWDWAGAWVCAERTPLMTVAERLQPEALYDRFVDYRESLGMHVLPLTGGEPPLHRLAQWLEGGGLVCLLADRDLSRSGLTVQLLGEPARVPAGPAVLAERTGATLLPVTLAHRGRDLEITFHPPVAPGSVLERTQGVADAFTAGFREHPADWHMMQRVFEVDLQ